MLVGTPCVSASMDSIPDGSFTLETDSSQRVTLVARDAPLDEILSQLSRQLDIPVTASLPDEPRITMAFEDRPLSEALKQMAGSYMLIADELDGRVTGVYVLPEGEVPPQQLPDNSDHDAGTADEPSNTSFQFEFDPGAAPEEPGD